VDFDKKVVSNLMEMPFGKHVIFLAAGASKHSGYPLANDLRLLISSRDKWEEALSKYQDRIKTADVGKVQIASLGLDFWDKYRNVINLFRNGGFATLDEFCKLAGNQLQPEINGLRRLVRAALGLFNPEEHFENSEYYGFVQALFEADLKSLRNDVTILTYNYDPYLEFLLFRALEHRLLIRQAGKGGFMSPDDQAERTHHESLLDAATSGFHNPSSQAWLKADESEPRFCVLKLHGSICYQKDQVADYDTLFSIDPRKRAEKLFLDLADHDTPPLLFPWEIMTDGGFVGRDSILFQQYKSLVPLFRGIWERARREVQAADKISFVGLSMHSFLTDGLKYLFGGKKKRVEACLANPENVPFARDRSETHWNRLPNSPANKLADTFRNVAPGMSWCGYSLADKREDGDITLVRDFSEFIKTQMKPIPQSDPARPV